MAEEDDSHYRWEERDEQAFLDVRQTEDGLLDMSSVHESKRRRLAQRRFLRARENLGSIKRGMIRYLYIAIDVSQNMSDTDLRPSRMEITLKVLREFVNDFFVQNPLSSLGVLVTGGNRPLDAANPRNSRAETLCPLTSNRTKVLQALDSANFVPFGDASLQNLLDFACRLLQTIPKHASREVLVTYGSLTTCDPGDIQKTVQELKTEKIICSIIGLSAQVKVCQTITDITHGRYDVILDEIHYSDLIKKYATPPPILDNILGNILMMGFPMATLSTTQSLCVCHNFAEDAPFSSKGFFLSTVQGEAL